MLARNRRASTGSSIAAARERVRAHDPPDVRSQPASGSAGGARTALARRARARAACSEPSRSAVRLAEVVEQRREPHRERCARVGGRLHDLEDVLVERQALAAAVLLEADTAARTPAAARRARRCRARAAAPSPGWRRAAASTARPSRRREPAADPLRRDEPIRRRPLAHLAQRLLVGLEAELRDEAEAADDPQRVLAEARRPRRAQDAAARSSRPPSGSTARRLEPAGDRVDGEVAPRHVVLERDADASATISKSCRPGPGRALDRAAARTRSRPARAPAARGRAASSRRPTALVGDDRGPRPGRAARARRAARRVDARDEEVARPSDRSPSSSSRTAPPTT